MSHTDQQLKAAIEGDINAFQALFGGFHDQLKSYLFRLTANRADAEDIAHDTFIRAFDKLSTFAQKSSFKTWVFQIATHLAYNELQKRKRWTADVSQQAKELVMSNSDLGKSIEQVSQNSPYGKFEIKEHIDTCFTCVSKTLLIENQVALLLKDVYDFSVSEIMMILGKSLGQTKYLLQHARATMTNVFDKRCSLVNKQGICHQCSELNGWLNPKQDQLQAKMKVKMAREAGAKDKEALFSLRIQLIKAIDPLRSNGHELQEVLMDCNRLAMGEIS
ncbi:MAG: RNA polymerase sigma factor [Bacteroidia bacterium]|nr:RNA polymerase sigma factor [Bacteroidia bacterium]